MLIFFKINTFEIFLQEYQQFQKVSNSLDPDEAGVQADQKLQRLSADGTSRHFAIEKCHTLLSTRCSMLGFFFINFCRLLAFIKINFFKKKSFRKIFRVSKSVNPYQARRFADPDLCLNCLQTAPGS